LAKVGRDVFSTPRVTAEQRGDGTLVLRSVEPLGDYARSLVRLFRSDSEAHPGRTLAAQRMARDGRRSPGATRENVRTRSRRRYSTTGSGRSGR
jgi:hypothetical protein